MKRKIYSIITFLLTLAISVFSLVACDKEGSAKAEILSKTDTMVVIKVTEAKGLYPTLLDAMNYLKEEGKLNFEIVGGMVSSIEGKANPLDYSSCWMVYTSDTEMACSDDPDVTYDTIDYDGNTYGLTILGAESLPVAVNAYYIWAYISFKAE